MCVVCVCVYVWAGALIHFVFMMLSMMLDLPGGFTILPKLFGEHACIRGQAEEKPVCFQKPVHTCRLQDNCR